MKHVYLTRSSVDKALQNHAITQQEAQCLNKKIKCQKKITQVKEKHQ